MKNNVLIALVAVLALVVGVLMRLDDGNPGRPESTKLDFSFPDVNGQMQAVSQWQGKILLINFWATWCPPCLKEIPEFVKWQQEFAENGIQFVGISLDEQAAVADYLKTIELNYPMLVAGDAGAMLAQQLGNILNAVPFTVVVNQQGQIVYRQPGELSREQFLKVVQPLFGVSPN